MVLIGFWLLLVLAGFWSFEWFSGRGTSSPDHSFFIPFSCRRKQCVHVNSVYVQHYSWHGKYHGLTKSMPGVSGPSYIWNIHLTARKYQGGTGQVLIENNATKLKMSSIPPPSSFHLLFSAFTFIRWTKTRNLEGESIIVLHTSKISGDVIV